jgi:hypothetical protein
LQNLLHVEYERFLMGGENKKTITFFRKTGVSNTIGKAAPGVSGAGCKAVKNQFFTVFIKNEEFFVCDKVLILRRRLALRRSMLELMRKKELGR